MFCDSVTPSEATLPILTFVTNRLINNTRAQPQAPTSYDPNSSAEEPVPVAYDLDDGLSLELKNFEALLSRLPDSGDGIPLSAWFKIFLWTARSIDAFFVLFEELDLLFLSSDMVQEWYTKRRLPDRRAPRVSLSATSLLGIFVRRAKVEFEHLQFAEVIELWNDFVAYRGNPESYMKDADSDVHDSQGSFEMLDWRSNGRLFNMLGSGMGSESPADERLSTADVGHLLEFQIDEMQKLGMRIPKEVKDRLWQLIGQSAENPSLAYYARFLDDWYAGDYASSFENLHRFYDYTMNKDRSNYQYALLNMAILQADFGCLGEAVAAMDECIATARENKDFPCLNFSLSWLYHLHNIHPGQMDDEAGKSMFGSERKGLAFLKEKAKEGKMWSVLSSTLLNEAKLSLSKGRNPRESFERIYESSHLNVQHQLSGVQSAQLLIQSSIFSRLGIADLANSYCQLALDCYGQSSPREEFLRATCRKAYALALSGKWTEAFRTLKHLKTQEHAILRTLKFKQFYDTFGRMLELKRRLLWGDLASAERLIALLRVAPGADPELTFQISMLEVDYLVRKELYTSAFEMIEHLADECEKQDADVYQRIRLLCAKVFLFAKCGRPQKGFTLALRATTAALQGKIIPALWEAVAALAVVLIGVSQFKSATQLLEVAIPQAREVQDHGLQATLCSIAADALVGAAAENEDDVIAMKDLMAAKVHLTKALDLYTSIDDLNAITEMLTKLTLLAELRDDKEEAQLMGDRAMKSRRSLAYPPMAGY